MNGAALAVSIMAIIISLAAALYSRAQAVEAKRSADVAERDEQRALDAARECAWSLIWQPRREFALVNRGPANASTVSVEDEWGNVLAAWDEISAAAKVTFNGRVASSRPIFKVMWITDSGEPREWTSEPVLQTSP